MTFPLVSRFSPHAGQAASTAPASTRGLPVRIARQTAGIVLALSCFALGAIAVIAIRVLIWVPGILH